MASFTLTLPDMVVVTGTASGLGQEIGKLLLENGSQVIGVDVAPSELVGRDGYLHITGSIAEPETWEMVGKEIDAQNSGWLGFVACAAVLDVSTVPEATLAMINKIMSVNVTGTVLGMGATIPRMIASGRGSVVAVASVNATLAEQQLAIYNASKAAVRQLARTAALDHARQGVRINVLSPGPMMAGLFKRHAESASDTEKFVSTRANRQPQGRILEAEDVALCALFLLSDGASALLGTDIVADGGLTTGFDFRTGAEGASV
jgi:NAD(P)-dependent dehydrogenase (short-subunit alcohol dehydrogenase family)